MTQIPYEDRKHNPEAPHIGVSVPRAVAERFWRMSRARGDTGVSETFIAAVDALAREMNAARAA